MTSRTFFELQRVRAAAAANTATDRVRRAQFQRVKGSVSADPVLEVYAQHKPDWQTASTGDPIRRAYERLGILYE